MLLYISTGETMENDMDKLIAMGKPALIQMAWKLVMNRQLEFHISYEDYEPSVWVNKHEVQVKFRRLIRYIPASSHFEYDITVALISKEISPFDSWFYRNNFFVPDKEQRQTISYLKELLGLPYSYMNHEISEDDENYYVNTNSKTAFCHYIVNKRSGEPSEPLQGTYAVLPQMFPECDIDEENQWVELK